MVVQGGRNKEFQGQEDVDGGLRRRKRVIASQRQLARQSSLSFLRSTKTGLLRFTRTNGVVRRQRRHD
jgi:hypothetical protein